MTGAFFLAIGALMIPAAIAWACNPQAHINLNQTSYAPGAPVTIYGDSFVGNAAITITSPTGTTSVTTSAGGAFTATVTAPTAPGDYAISASKPTGGSAPAAFSVAAPAVAPTPAPRTPSFTAPKVTSTSTAPRAVAHASHPSSAATSAPASTSAGTTVSNGQTVFAGSAAAPAVATPVVGAARTTKAASGHRHAASHAATARTTAPSGSQLTASSDLWSGFAPGRSSSLTAGAGGMMNSSGTSSALTIGIGLLAVGLIGLVAGLTGAEVRRRRAVSKG